MTRRPFVAGNWKMNLDLPAARKLVSDLRASLGAAPAIDIAICPTAVYLFPMAKAVADTPIRLGAQNCWHEPDGAFTGEVSADMVKEAGCAYVVLGHSERRHVIGPRGPDGRVWAEDDAMVAAKCRAALRAGLVPIVCLGETLEQRDAGRTEDVLDRQIAGSLQGVDPDPENPIVIAYEPVWAIGTGRNATPEQAQEAHRHIRKRLADRFGPDLAGRIRIQYGGSVKPNNALDLMKCPDVDGALVGGASLEAAGFAAIIEATLQAKGLKET